MAKTSLSTYTIEAYSTNKDNNTPLNFKLDNLNEYTVFKDDTEGKYNTLSSILESFLNKDHSFNYKNKFLNINCHNEDLNLYYGQLNYGPYGTEHDVIDATTNELTEKKITLNDSVLTPYYFYIKLFENRKDALLILETKSNSGIKIIFEKWLNYYLTEIGCTHFKLKIDSFIPKEMLDKFSEEGHVRKIRYLSYKLPKDSLKIFDDYNPNEGYAEYTVSIKKGKSKKHQEFLKKIFSNDENSSKELMKNIDFPAEDIKLELELDEDKRTFTIGNLSKTRPLKDISMKLDFGENGHRTFKSIHKIASKYAEDIINAND
nr:hypothetical protein [uncultured Methanobrevibacter sp.]